MEKPTIRICENKDADQLHGNREADQRLCFRYSDSTFPLLSKFQASNSFLCLYRSVCVGLVRFSHEAAHRYTMNTPILLHCIHVYTYKWVMMVFTFNRNAISG